MIIWINGSFGSGKTSVASRLSEMIDDSFVYDPEEAGQFLRKSIPSDLHLSDFQDQPMWRTLNFDMLKNLDSVYEGIVIVPMTLVSEQYFSEIVGRLRSDDVKLLMFTLVASRKTIEARLIKRGKDNGKWVFDQIDRCVLELEKPIYSEHILTDDKSIDEICKYILKICSL